MRTMTKQKVEMKVNVFQKSVTYQVTTLFQVMFRITKARGLASSYITNNRDVLERGFFTWFSERMLETLYFEIVTEDGSKALERWEVNFDYSDNPDPEVRKPPIEQLESFCKKLRTLPRGTYYRILVQTKPGASEVEGWYPTSFKPFSQSNEKSFSGYGFGNIGAKLWYREGKW